MYCHTFLSEQSEQSCLQACLSDLDKLHILWCLFLLSLDKNIPKLTQYTNKEFLNQRSYTTISIASVKMYCQTNLIMSILLYHLTYLPSNSSNLLILNIGVLELLKCICFFLVPNPRKVLMQNVLLHHKLSKRCMTSFSYFFLLFSLQTLRARAKTRAPKPVKKSSLREKVKSINNITCCNNGTDINSSNQSNAVAEGKMLQKSPNPSVSIT